MRCWRLESAGKETQCPELKWVLVSPAERPPQRHQHLQQRPGLGGGVAMNIFKGQQPCTPLTPTSSEGESTRVLPKAPPVLRIASGSDPLLPLYCSLSPEAVYLLG